MSDWEREHIVDAFRFELGKVDHDHVREGVVGHLAHVDGDLAARVAAGLGVAVPEVGDAEDHDRRSPALSQDEQPGGLATRKIAVLAADGVDAAALDPVLERLREAGAKCEVLAPRDGELKTADGGSLTIDRALTTMSSVLYDAVLVAPGEQSAAAITAEGEAVHYVAEAYRHAKAVGAIGAGVEVLRRAPLGDRAGVENGGSDVAGEAGLVVLADPEGGDLDAFATAFADAVAAHRNFRRDASSVPA